MWWICSRARTEMLLGCGEVLDGVRCLVTDVYTWDGFRPWCEKRAGRGQRMVMNERYGGDWGSCLLLYKGLWLL